MELIPVPTRALAPEAPGTLQRPAISAMVCLGDAELGGAIVALAASLGLEPTTVMGRGAALVELVAEAAPSVLVLDLALTGTDGLSTLAAIKVRSAGTEIILSSPLQTVPVAAFEAGASYVVAEGDVGAVRRALAAISASSGVAGSQSTNAPSR